MSYTFGFGLSFTDPVTANVAKTMSSNKRREIIHVETLQEIRDNNPKTQTEQQNDVERSEIANGRCL